jgi:beta-alanine--pyruvate transaminase
VIAPGRGKFLIVVSRRQHVVELFHGYTYSVHPLACAGALATLDLYRNERLSERAKKLES